MYSKDKKKIKVDEDFLFSMLRKIDATNKALNDFMGQTNMRFNDIKSQMGATRIIPIQQNTKEEAFIVELAALLQKHGKRGM